MLRFRFYDWAAKLQATRGATGAQSMAGPSAGAAVPDDVESLGGGAMGQEPPVEEVVAAPGLAAQPESEGDAAPDALADEPTSS